MRPQFEYHTEKTLEQSVFYKLRIRYLFAFLAIAVAILVSQVLVQMYLNKQLHDSRAINVAGRQRMLSQKISKDALRICNASDTEKQQKFATSLKASIELWKQSYVGLVEGDSILQLDGEISLLCKQMFDSIHPYYNNIVEASYGLITKVERGETSIPILCKDLLVIMANEGRFLDGMDEIVFLMDKEARERVMRLKSLEYLLLLITIGILVFEILFIFRPIALYIRQIVANLVKSEKDEKVRGAANLKKKGEEQKLRSTLIFEGQERERRRLSRDLHDGIGQLLTGLKFQLEAIDVSKADVTKQTVHELKILTANIIKEIRRTSFNLRPSVLSDYGIASAIKNMVQELNKYTETDITFSNLTGFESRLHKKVEAQLYRLTQEAVNNALKHAQAGNIQIRLWHKSYFIAISVMDDGVGFNHEEVIQDDMKTRSGHGLLNMQERANFIDAELNIKSSFGKGTEVSIHLPLE